MKKLMYIGLAAIALVACNNKPASDKASDKPTGETSRATSPVQTAPDSANPQLYIVAGKYIVVDQEPLQFILTEGKNEPVTITWRLPKEGGYRFVKEGIRVARCEDRADERKADEHKEGGKCADSKNDASRDIVDCGPTADGTEYQCRNLRTTIGTFKYSITVEKGGVRLPVLDPSGHNGDK